MAILLFSRLHPYLASCKMKSFLQISFLTLFIAWLSGCTSTYYVPNSANVPLLSEKNEAQVNANFKATYSTVSYDIQAAYSPIENLGVKMNIS